MRGKKRLSGGEQSNSGTRKGKKKVSRGRTADGSD